MYTLDETSGCHYRHCCCWSFFYFDEREEVADYQEQLGNWDMVIERCCTGIKRESKQMHVGGDVVQSSVEER